MTERTDLPGDGAMFDDDRLQQLVAEVFERSEPVPDDALHVAYAAIGMAALSEELATMVFDSVTDGDLVLMRSSEHEHRLLTYEREGLTLDVELHDDGVTIVGLIDSGDSDSSGPTLIDVEAQGGPTVTAPVDDQGRFRVEGPPGVVRLRIPGRLITPWIMR